jgi:hypothetical protein
MQIVRKSIEISPAKRTIQHYYELRKYKNTIALVRVVSIYVAHDTSNCQPLRLNLEEALSTSVLSLHPSTPHSQVGNALYSVVER